MRILLVAMFFSQIIACDPNVEIEQLNPENIIAVSCFVSPQDSTFDAYLFRAGSIGSTIRSDSAAIKDAIVTISDGEYYDTLLLVTGVDSITQRPTYKYSCKRKWIEVKSNSKYFLEISTPQGDHAFASCIIPPQPETPTIIGYRDGDDYSFTINWNNPSKHIYFSIVLDAEGSYTYPPGGSYIVDLKPNLLEEITFPSENQTIVNVYEAILPFAYKAENPILKVSVRNFEESLYSYFKSFQQFENWDINNSGTFIPNFGDVPIIYNNINGGVGIFGAFNSSSTSVEIE